MQKTRLSDGLWLYLAVSALILLRTSPFVVFGREINDSDEAVFGILAKIMAKTHAIPVFMYGQKEHFSLPRLPLISWMTAPLFAAFGSSVALLRLPMLVMNMIIGNALAYLIRREARLPALTTFLCCLWFLLPSAHSSYGLMDAANTVPETFIFILLIWALRGVPLLGGFAAGLGMCARPFVLYGVLASLLIEYRSEKSTKGFVLKTLQWSAGIIASYLAVFWLANHAATFWGLAEVHVAKHFRFMLEDVRGFFAEILPQTIGLQTQRFRSINEALDSHFSWLGLLLCPLGAYLVFILIRTVWRSRSAIWKEQIATRISQFPYYLALVGLITFGSYVVFSPPSDDIRYTYLILLGMVGLYVLQHQLSRDERVKKLALVLLLGCMANNVFANARMGYDLFKLNRAHPTQNLVRYMREHQVRGAIGDYWASYNITFESDEEVLVVPGTTGTFLPQYNPVFLAIPEKNRGEIRLSPCPGCQPVESWYVRLPLAKR